MDDARIFLFTVISDFFAPERAGRSRKCAEPPIPLTRHPLVTSYYTTADVLMRCGDNWLVNVLYESEVQKCEAEREENSARPPAAQRQGLAQLGAAGAREFRGGSQKGHR